MEATAEEHKSRADAAEHQVRMLKERLRCVDLDPGTSAYFDALDAMTEGRLAEALTMLRSLVAKEPSNMDYRTGLELALGLEREEHQSQA